MPRAEAAFASPKAAGTRREDRKEILPAPKLGRRRALSIATEFLGPSRAGGLC